MNTWPTVALGEVATVHKTTADPSTLDPKTPYIGLEHIEKGGQHFSFSSIAESSVTSTKHEFAQDHVLIGKLRPNLAKVVIPKKAGICSTDILPVQTSERLDKCFLRYHLLRPEIIDWVAGRASGANLPRISPKTLSEMPTPP